jgi:hypothetical protein
MFARVVSWEGADPAILATMLDDIKSQAAAGPPEGVPSTGMLLLSDRDAGRTMMIALFATAEDRRVGNEKLNSMSPPVEGGLGRRLDVELLDVEAQM